MWGTPLDVIENIDAHVVMDDMCMETRHFWSDVEITLDPWTASPDDI